MLRGLLRWGREGSGKGASVLQFSAIQPPPPIKTADHFAIYKIKVLVLPVSQSKNNASTSSIVLLVRVM